MVHGDIGQINNTFVLPDNNADPNCPGSAIWTNLTDEEIKICFASGKYTIPH